jgi:hypothetical protein
MFFLPTVATTAWYHKLLSTDLQKENVESVAHTALQFAHGEYAAALETKATSCRNAALVQGTGARLA